MSTTLSELDNLAITSSFGAACGITALHLALESLPDDEADSLKESIISSWRGSWNEVFQKRISEYLNEMNKVNDANHLEQPEDYQSAFNIALAKAEKSARVSLRMEGNG